MCFISDPEWHAQICEQTTRQVEKPIRCDECHEDIQPGETVHSIFMQESEECLACQDGDCECDPAKGDCCQCAEPTFGETFDYNRCENCDKFLKSVEAAELEAGCRAWESRPSLPNMVEDVSEGGIREARKYFKKARVLFPELVESRYLGRLWRKMFPPSTRVV